MAILGKTSITELNLITPLSNANLENSKITISGADVPLGGSYNLITSGITSSLLYTLGQGDSNPTDNTWYITSVSSGTGTTFYKRSHSYLYGYLKGKFDSVYQSKGEYALKSDFDASTEVTASALNTINGTLANCALKSDIPGVFTGATLSAVGKMGLVPAPAQGDMNKYLSSNGSWVQPTVCTAGAFNNDTNKLFLIGAPAQTSNGVDGIITFSNSNVYMQAGKLYANGSEVGTMATINNTVSALTSSHVNLDSRITELENGGGGATISASTVLSTVKHWLVSTTSTSGSFSTAQIFNGTSTGSLTSGAWIENGKLYVTQGFYQVSDERVKDFKEDVEIDFDKLKSIPKSYFTWKGDEDEKLEIGTSAQKLKEVYPELVSYDSADDRYTVSYDKLSVVALKAVDKLHEENEMLKAMLFKMEERLSKLENNK